MARNSGNKAGRGGRAPRANASLQGRLSVVQAQPRAQPSASAQRSRGGAAVFNRLQSTTTPSSPARRGASASSPARTSNARGRAILSAAASSPSNQRPASLPASSVRLTPAAAAAASAAGALNRPRGRGAPRANSAPAASPAPRGGRGVNPEDVVITIQNDGRRHVGGGGAGIVADDDDAFVGRSSGPLMFRSSQPVLRQHAPVAADIMYEDPAIMRSAGSLFQRRPVYEVVHPQHHHVQQQPQALYYEDAGGAGYFGALAQGRNPHIPTWALQDGAAHAPAASIIRRF